MTHAPDFGPLMLRVAEATMIPTHGAPSQARAVDSSPPAPSSAPADAPAGRTPSSLSVGASAPPCPRCGGEEVVAVGGPDMFGNYETTDCHCARPDHVEAPGGAADAPGA